MWGTVMPVVILYKSYPWIRVALQSFRRHFPLGPLLIIDNNPDEDFDKIWEEKEWVRRWREQDSWSFLEVTPFDNKRHGLAMDFAVQWCRDRGIRWLLHFEPDCMILGIEWVRSLLEAAHKDIWMAGSHQKIYGPIHPTPSIWDVNHIHHSFDIRLRGDDILHPKFSSLVDLNLLKTRVCEEEWGYWGRYWDTAQKNWFEAAKEGKARLVDDTKDFLHFWSGSTNNTDPRRCIDLRVLEYLQNFSG